MRKKILDAWIGMFIRALAAQALTSGSFPPFF
jgi:hypothetical protein